MARPPCCTTAWEMRASPVKISRKSSRRPCCGRIAACAPSQIRISSSDGPELISPTFSPP
eukprot:6488120-Pyramimonas_sp.AAC.1